MAKTFVRYGIVNPPGYVICTWNSMDRPNVEIGRLLIDGVDVPFIGGFTARNLAPVMHEFKFYDSSDGIALDQRILKLDIDASQSIESSVLIFRYKVGRGEEETNPTLPYWEDPGDEETTLTDERLAGATYDNLEVHIQGIGDLDNSQFEIFDTGGIGLLGGLTFSKDSFLNIKYYSQKVVTAQPSVGVSVLSEPINIVNSDSDFTDEMRGKNNIGLFNTLIGETRIPAFSGLSDGYAIFSTFSGSQRYWTIKLATATKFMGKDRTKIHLGSNERLVLAWQSGVGYILDYEGDYKLVGQKINGDKEYVNTFKIVYPVSDQDYNVYNQADFIRLWEELPDSQKVPDLDWNKYLDRQIHIPDKYYRYFYNRGKYSIVGSTQFKFPSLRGYMMKFIADDGENLRFTQGAGSIEMNRTLEHIHSVMEGHGGSSTGAILGTGFSGQDAKSYFVSGLNLIDKTGEEKNIVDNFGQSLLIRI